MTGSSSVNVLIYISAEIVMTFSVLTCQAEQFMSDSAEILIFTQQLSAENRPTLRRIQTGLLCRARTNIFIGVHLDIEWGYLLYHFLVTHEVLRSDIEAPRFGVVLP